MVELTFDSQVMVLSIKGWHRLWAFKSELRIPLSHVKQARKNNDEITSAKGWKSPGTYIPGIIIAGTYRSHGKKVFWDVVHKENAIIIDLQDDDYQQIVVEVENPEIAIERINQKIA